METLHTLPPATPRPAGPSIEAVARAAGVSVATVSRAFHDGAKLAAATRTRVRAVARRMAYYPRVVPNKRNKVAFVLDAQASLAADPYVAQWTGAVLDGLAVRGFSVVLQRARSAAELSAAVEEGFFNALLVLGGPEEGAAWNRPDGGSGLRALAERIPVLTLNFDLGAPTHRVASDHAQGGRLAAAGLLARGHRRIAYLAPGAEWSVLRERRDGFLAAVRRARAESLVLAGPEVSLVEALARVKREGWSAAVLAQQQLTLPALRALQLLGVRVPEDLSLAGFEGLGVSAYTNPPLSTVRQPILEMGTRAAERSAELLARPPARRRARVDDVFPNEWLARESIQDFTPRRKT